MAAVAVVVVAAAVPAYLAAENKGAHHESEKNSGINHWRSGFAGRDEYLCIDGRADLYDLGREGQLDWHGNVRRDFARLVDHCDGRYQWKDQLFI